MPKQMTVAVLGAGGTMGLPMARNLARAGLEVRAWNRSPDKMHPLAEDDVQPIIFYGRFATCRQPQVKGLTVMVNSLFNGWRMEDVWLDK